MENRDCKTCVHATALYERVEDGDRFTAEFIPSGLVRCRGPRYKGRVYTCRDSKPGCSEYQRRARSS